MKTYLRRYLMVALLVVLSFNTLGCNKYVDTSKTENSQSTENTENAETMDLGDKKNEINKDKELLFNSSKTLEENVDILNNILEAKYGKRLSLSTAEDYEKSGQSDWTLILEDNRVGIDTSTWKFDYDLNSNDSLYMDAVLSTFIFFCGEDMGNSLWLLTADLLDGGADETLYGFEHNGSQAVYKNGNVAAYEFGNNESTMYIWLTPSKY